jgi:hypothetical protein
MGSTAERPVLLDGSIPLQQESFLDNLFDLGFFPGKVPLSVAAGYSEPSRQKQHGKSPQPKWAMNLIAVMLGRKQ